MKLTCDTREGILARTGLEPDGLNITGIYIRAQWPHGNWDSVDIACLDAPSLLEWLRGHDGDNMLAENVVGVLLGHGHIRQPEGQTDDT